MQEIVERLASIRGVEAVALGGTRARGRERDDSDWDLALYYRRSIDTDAIRELGFPGTVTEPGEMGVSDERRGLAHGRR